MSLYQAKTMQILFKLNCVILFATSLVLLPTLLAASLWKTHVRQRNGQAANDVANTRDDYYAEQQNQVVYLDDIVDNSHAELKVKHKESYVKPSRYGSSAYQQSVADTSQHHADYASDVDYTVKKTYFFR
ncbi:uncharacterized protein LOC123466988 [Daphnia magna]|nr:uncharacterized protein LOC123466988 [Daphnia magna]